MNMHRKNGFALIEALVAALLLSIGVLGIVGLQIATVSDYRDTKTRQYATMMVTDLADRMRANRAAIAHYKTSNLASAEDKPCASDAAAPCAPPDLALDDLHHWQQSLVALGFDAARTSVVVDAAVSPVTVSVTLGWASRSDTPSITLKTEVL